MDREIMLPIISPVVAGKHIFNAENLKAVNIRTHR